MPKCDFNKVAKQLGFSPVNLLHIFRTPFPRNSSGWLLPNLSELVFQLLNKSKDNDCNLTLTYQIGEIMRNKILNYKEAVNFTIVISCDYDFTYGDQDVSLRLSTDQCNYADSSFCDPHHKYIVRGDLQIIKINKISKLLTKGPNYREPQTIKLYLPIFMRH